MNSINSLTVDTESSSDSSCEPTCVQVVKLSNVYIQIVVVLSLLSAAAVAAKLLLLHITCFWPLDHWDEIAGLQQ